MRLDVPLTFGRIRAAKLGHPRAGGVALIAKEMIAAEATESISCGLWLRLLE
jgi:hypothetical protein